MSEVMNGEADILREQIKVLTELQKAYEAEPLVFFKPHKYQHYFFEAGDYKYRYCPWPNRTGKSEMVSAEVVSYLMGYRAFYAEGDERRTRGIQQRACRVLVVCKDYKKVREIFTQESGYSHAGKIWKFLPKGSIKKVLRLNDGSGTIIGIYLNNGSSLMFMTIDQYKNDRQVVESGAYEVLVYDEPPPEGMHIGLSRGLIDSDGSIIACVTPLFEGWLDDFFLPVGGGIEEDENGVIRYETETGRKKYFYCTCPYDGNPYVSEEAREDFYSGIRDEEELEARRSGRSYVRLGKVIREFDSGRHVLKGVPRGWESPWSPPRDYTIYFAIDPHPKTPTAVLFAAVSPNYEIFIWAEMFIRLMVPELADNIFAILNGRSFMPAVIDPSANQPSIQSDDSVADELNNLGIPTVPGSKRLIDGIFRMRDEFAKPDGLYIMEHCVRTIHEVERYHWDRDKNKPVDKDDHMVENLRRLIQHGMIYVEDQSENYKMIPEPKVGGVGARKI